MKKGKQQNTDAPETVASVFHWQETIPLGMFLMISMCLITSDMTAVSTMKLGMLILLPITALCCVVFRKRLIQRLSLVGILVSAWAILGWLSGLYAPSAQFALNEISVLTIPLCFFLLCLIVCPKGEAGAKFVASIVAVATATSGFLSIDLIATRLLSGPVQTILSSALPSITQHEGVEVGVRITSLLGMPNVFAGYLGLGVLLSLGLTSISQTRGERWFYRTLLAINSLAFALAFSMGASGVILLGFLGYLLLERKEQRMKQLVLMVETLTLTLLALFPIYLTAFDSWDGINVIPLVCTVVAAALLSCTDDVVGRRIATVADDHPRVAIISIGAVLGMLILFGVLAVNLTGEITLSSGETLRRSSYPQSGHYTLDVVSDGSLSVTIESQNEEETMMHTSTVLYSGDAASATFDVPEDSLVVYYQFKASEETLLEQVTEIGGESSQTLKLNYILLPGFIANRLQGLFANENAIQRAVFFEDGMKLFSKSPILGLGMGAFENGVLGVQDFHYETKYTHNHYIQMLVDMGVVGLVIFVGVLGLSAWCILRCWRRGNPSSMIAALGGCVLFMAGHGMVELIFSSGEYLLPAFGVLAALVLLAGEQLPIPQQGAGAPWMHRGIILCLSGFLLGFTVMLGINAYAYDQSTSATDYDSYFTSVEFGATWDYYGQANYLMSYVNAATGETDPEIIAQATIYAQMLEQKNSNISALYVAKFYFAQGELEQAFAMLEKHVDYTASDAARWDQAFQAALEQLTEENFDDSLVYIQALYDSMVAWQESHMGTLTLNSAISDVLSQIIIMESSEA